VSEAPHVNSAVTEVSRLELFFDLVFVFTITQFTGVLEHRPSLTGALQAALMLAIVWWMYGGYAWLTNLVPPDRAGRRVAMVCGMGSYLVLALAIPRAFEGEGLPFGLAYLLVVLVHGGLFTISTEVSLSVIYRGFFPVNVCFALLVVAGGALGGGWQYALWAVTAAAAWTSPRLIPDQSHLISAHHFIERHALVVLVALGESVVAVGIGATGNGLDAGTLVGITLGMAVSAGLWWSYFGEADDELRERGFAAAVAAGRHLVAVRAYGLAFAALLGGVVLASAALRHTVAHPGHALSVAQALFLGAGVGLFLVADQTSRMWMTIRASGLRLAVAVLAVVTSIVGTSVSGGAQELALVALLLAAFVAESRRRPVRPM
jgi:low temperature requirement protein LtrA